MVETKDTGPFCIAQNANNIATGAIVSLQMSKATAEFLRSTLIHCLTTCGRTETNKKVVDIQKALSENMFQNEI